MNSEKKKTNRLVNLFKSVLLFDKKKCPKQIASDISVYEIIFLQFVVLLPTFTWRSSNQHLVGQFVIANLFGFAIENNLSIQLLSQNTKVENLAQRPCNFEWRTGFLFAFTGFQEVCIMVRRTQPVISGNFDSIAFALSAGIIDKVLPCDPPLKIRSLL